MKENGNKITSKKYKTIEMCWGINMVGVEKMCGCDQDIHT